MSIAIMKKQFYKKIVISSLLCILLISIQYAQSIGRGGTTLTVLDMEYGAQPLGMGGAYVAAVDDVMSVQWNPGALMQIHQQEIGAIYQNLFAGSSFYHAGYAYPWYRHGVAATSISYVTSGNIIGIGLNQESLGSYSAYQAVWTVAFAQSLSLYQVQPWLRDFDIGAALKLINGHIYEYDAVSIGMDAGIRWEPHSLNVQFLKDFVFGLRIKHIIPPFAKYGETREFYPLNTQLGISYRVLYDTLILNADVGINWFRRELPNPRFGVEYFVYDVLKIRAGIKEKNLAFGLGLLIEDFQVDYALVWHNSLTRAENDNLGLMHQITAVYRFGDIIP